MDKENLLNDVTETRNSLLTQKLDMSFGEILSMYESEEIIIDPEFQRLFRWSHHQQTRFIESLLLGIPVPPIFVAETEDGRWEVVDGLQRISTVISFLGQLKTLPHKNNWALLKGDLIPLMEGFKYTDLPLRLQLNLKRSIIRVEIINWNSTIDMRYELFNRLNTGGSELKDQEIRNCIFRGITNNFNVMLKELANNEIFVNLIRPTEKQQEELYLEELVLRFISLADSWEDMDETISIFMTKYMRNAVSDLKYDYDYRKKLFYRTIKVLSPFHDVFRGRNYVFATSLFDAITVGVALNIDSFELLSKEEIQVKINTIKEARKTITSAASSKKRVINSIRKALEFLSG